LSKVIKACFVKQEFNDQVSGSPASHKTGPIKKNIQQEEFSRETSAEIYRETKEMVNELVSEAEKKAAAIIADAQKQADRIITQGQQEADELRRKAYEEGAEQGYQESMEKTEQEIIIYKEQTKELIGKLGEIKKNYLSDHLDDLLDLIFMITKKILNTAIEFKPELIASVVKNVLEETGDAETLIIRVNPLHVPFLDLPEENLSEKRKFTIEPDPSIKPGDCIVETEKGFIDAQIDEQLHYLKNILKDEHRNAGL
jgi:flagellar assembly protein FliH